MEESAIDTMEASPKSRPRSDQGEGGPARRKAADEPLPIVSADEPTRSPRAEKMIAPFESQIQELTCTSEASSSNCDSCQLAIDDANAKVEAMKFRDIQKELKVRLCHRVGVPLWTVFCPVTIAIKYFETVPCIMLTLFSFLFLPGAWSPCKGDNRGHSRETLECHGRGYFAQADRGAACAGGKMSVTGCGEHSSASWFLGYGGVDRGAFSYA